MAALPDQLPGTGQPMNHADLHPARRSGLDGRSVFQSRAAADHFIRPATAAPLLLALAAALAMCAAAPAGAQGQALSNGATPSDTAIAADQRSFVAQEEAIEALNRSGKHRLASYSLAKAQCWLDVSFHEYTQNDRSAFPQQALQQSALITRFLGSGGAVDDAANPALSTPLVNQAPKLRDDLWQDALRLKTHAGYRCAERQVACGEVELVHAGNEYAQLGWRHAKPYVQIAEDYLGEARLAADACPPPAVPRLPEPPPPPPEPLSCPPVIACPEAPAPPPPPPPPPPAPEKAKVTRSFESTALFTFDGRTTGDLLPADRLKLRSTVMVLKNAYSQIDRIEVKGHTDRLGTPAYNLKLSQDRAEAIKRALDQDQIKVDVIATGRGAAEPKPETLSCKGDKPTKALIACLQPSRRVEFVVTGVLREDEVEAVPPAKP
jgi:outer membrane protein OmpA-like peptidoglycan-associated protein